MATMKIALFKAGFEKTTNRFNLNREVRALLASSPESIKVSHLSENQAIMVFRNAYGK